MAHLHIAIIPLMAHGHSIPMIDVAMLFASRGVKTTIISTPAFADPVKWAQESGHDIGLSIIKFPPEGSTLPDNIVSLDQITTRELGLQFDEALFLLQEPVERILQELHPNCLVSDMFLPWTTDSAAKFGIPRLIYHVASCFALCASEEMIRHKPYKNVTSDSEPFVLPNLPHELKFTRSQLPPTEVDESENDHIMDRARESEARSYGVLINSFYELESDYLDHYKKVVGRKAWHIGPLVLCNNTGAEEKALIRGKKSTIDAHECLAWLDSKRPNSVVYMCFGSMVSFSPAQLHETAFGLEASGQDFIWVVRKGKNEEDQNEDWLPEGFEERMKGKGLIIRGWAPQVMILDHPAIGAFVNHLGWNTTMEGVCVGVPMVTWPVFAEQFYHEKLVTEVLRTGVSVGNMKYQRVASEGVPREAVANAVRRVMVGEEAVEMRSRAKYYKEMARKAVEEGGSSYTCLSSLIDELSAYRAPSNKA